MYTQQSLEQIIPRYTLRSICGSTQNYHIISKKTGFIVGTVYINNTYFDFLTEYKDTFWNIHDNMAASELRFNIRCM